MLDVMVNKVVESLVQKQIIDDSEKDIYKYGYILLYEFVINLVLAFIMGVMFKSLGEVLFFLFVYIPLRSFCGGWHADKIWKCTLISNIILFLEIMCVKYVVQNVNFILLLLVFIVSVVIIICISPVETETKKISKIESVTYKKIINVITAVHILMLGMLTVMGIQNYTFIIVFAYIVQVSILLPEKIKKIKKISALKGKNNLHK